MRFDSELLPKVLAAVPRDLDEEMHVEDVVHASRESQRFDCSKLHPGFLIDTALERENELREHGNGIALPFPNCIFEFPDCVVLAGYSSITSGEEEADYVVFRAMRFFDAVCPFAFVELHSRRSATLFDMNSDPDDGSYLDPAGFPLSEVTQVDKTLGDKPKEEGLQRHGALLALGLITLMEEKLIRHRTIGGASLTRNARRKNEGKPELKSYRIVTLNLAETRRRVSGVRLMKHESPMLHWRRGHWRTLGRMSEFEKRTWVKRCLVGNPDKGFVNKHYRAIWSPTVH
jgi:hypothetical protein